MEYVKRGFLIVGNAASVGLAVGLHTYNNTDGDHATKAVEALKMGGLWAGVTCFQFLQTWALYKPETTRDLQQYALSDAVETFGSCFPTYVSWSLNGRMVDASITAGVETYNGLASEPLSSDTEQSLRLVGGQVAYYLALGQTGTQHSLAGGTFHMTRYAINQLCKLLMEAYERTMQMCTGQEDPLPQHGPLLLVITSEAWKPVWMDHCTTGFMIWGAIQGGSKAHRQLVDHKKLAPSEFSNPITQNNSGIVIAVGHTTMKWQVRKNAGKVTLGPHPKHADGWAANLALAFNMNPIRHMAAQRTFRMTTVVTNLAPALINYSLGASNPRLAVFLDTVCAGAGLYFLAKDWFDGLLMFEQGPRPGDNLQRPIDEANNQNYGTLAHRLRNLETKGKAIGQELETVSLGQVVTHGLTSGLEGTMACGLMIKLRGISGEVGHDLSLVPIVIGGIAGFVVMAGTNKLLGYLLTNQAEAIKDVGGMKMAGIVSGGFVGLALPASMIPGGFLGYAVPGVIANIINVSKKERRRQAMRPQQPQPQPQQPQQQTLSRKLADGLRIHPRQLYKQIREYLGYPLPRPPEFEPNPPDAPPLNNIGGHGGGGGFLLGGQQIGGGNPVAPDDPGVVPHVQLAPLHAVFNVGGGNPQPQVQIVVDSDGDGSSDGGSDGGNEIPLQPVPVYDHSVSLDDQEGVHSSPFSSPDPDETTPFQNNYPPESKSSVDDSNVVRTYRIHRPPTDKPQGVIRSVVGMHDTNLHRQVRISATGGSNASAQGTLSSIDRTSQTLLVRFGNDLSANQQSAFGVLHNSNDPPRTYRFKLKPSIQISFAD